MSPGGRSHIYKSEPVETLGIKIAVKAQTVNTIDFIEINETPF